MSFPIPRSRAVGGALVAGDRVDVLGVRRNSGVSGYVATDVPVLAFSSAGSGPLQGSDDASVTIAIDSAAAAGSRLRWRRARSRSCGRPVRCHCVTGHRPMPGPSHPPRRKRRAVSEPEIALVFTAEPWVEELHRHLSDHGGARVRSLVVEQSVALEETYDVLVVSHRWPALTRAFVADVHARGRSVLGVHDLAEPASRAHLAAVEVNAMIESDAGPDAFVRAVVELGTQRDVGARRPCVPGPIRSGRLIAVGGPPGVGRTEVAIGLAVPRRPGGDGRAGRLRRHCTRRRATSRIGARAEPCVPRSTRWNTAAATSRRPLLIEPRHGWPCSAEFRTPPVGLKCVRAR